jgi:cell division septation protein DedD
LASHTQDGGFHEIQLNGKQLVFLFMAATVVSVVIFLCGVLVGRGVRAGRGTAVETAGLADPAATELSLAASPRASGLPAEPPADAPRPAADDLSYFNRLDQPNPPVEALKATPAPATAAKPERPAPALSPPVREPAAPAAAASGAVQQAAATQPFAVQIAALNVRSEADAMAKRLSSKGYAAFVLPPANGTPAVYRVRIGPFNTRREADSVAARLQKEEQFKPWVTR